jgi:glucosylglycerate synthase
MPSTGSSSSAATPEPAAAAVDLLVGVLSYHDAATVGHVGAAVSRGLASARGVARAKVFVVSGDPEDGSAAQVRAAFAPTPDLLEVAPLRGGQDLLGMPYHGYPGKAHAVQMILSAARDIGARACIVLDGSVDSVSPAWIDRLADPILAHETDFVSPYYTRHPLEGALSKGVVYPLFRALYGVRARQPAAAEFACSARARDLLLAERFWHREGVNAGVDLWLSAAAASAELRHAEVLLGPRTHQRRGEQALDLAALVTQVVGALFTDIEQRAERWQRLRGSLPVQRFGEAATGSVPDVTLDAEALLESFRLGFRELQDVWTWVLPTRTIVDLRRLTVAPAGQFRFPDELWARTIYDFALGFRMRALARDHLLQSLVPLYLGWLSSFSGQVQGLDSDAVEARVDALAAVFEAQKNYFISRWRWPERLRG